MIFLSAKTRKEIPVDIEDYFFANPEIYAAIRADMKSDAKFDWNSVTKQGDVK